MSFGVKAVYKFGASDSNFQSMRPNDLLMWKAIEWYGKNGFQQLCFGRTDLSNEGLRRFKAKWGAEEKIVKYYRYYFNRKDFMTNSGTHRSKLVMFDKMPISLLRLIGAGLYKHIG